MTTPPLPSRPVVEFAGMALSARAHVARRAVPMQVALGRRARDRAPQVASTAR